ncbi:MAG: hypothetical protein FJX77_17370 [Armatimonadetes bacterium]|nr:hypothetical protein [Armatimonadota bacterium]
MIQTVAPPAGGRRVREVRYAGSREYYLVFSELLRAARYRGLVSYRELASLMGFPGRGPEVRREHLEELLALLGEIAREEFCHDRPPLGVLAVNGAGQPDLDFFYLLRELYEIDDWDPVQGFVEFWEALRGEVYATWAGS